MPIERNPSDVSVYFPTPLTLSEAEGRLRAQIAAEIAALADDDSDVSDAYRHAALIVSQGRTVWA